MAMLTYTFSRREKAMLLGLAIALLVVAWYALVYQNTTNEISRIEGEIAQVESDTTIAQAQVAQMEYMQGVVEQQKAAGAKPKPVPEYDNLQPLMAYLDSVMSSTESYELSFEELDTSDSTYVQRPVRVSFRVGAYSVAEDLVRSLANGPYTCLIDSVAVQQSNKSTGLLTTMVSGRSETEIGHTGTIHAIFYEKYPADGSLKPDSAKNETQSESTSSTS